MPEGSAGKVAVPSGDRGSRRVRRSAEVVIAHQVTGRLRERLWTLYAEAFDQIESVSISEQRVDLAHFRELMDHPSTYKVLGLVDGEPQGMILVTDRIDLVPGISEPAIAARYPDEWSRDAVYYAPFAFVARSCRIPNLYGSLIAAGSQIAASRSGVIIIDMCRELVENGQIRLIERALRGFEGAVGEEIDAQVYYAFRVPVPSARPVANVALTDVAVDLPDAPVSSSRADCSASSRDPKIQL